MDEHAARIQRLAHVARLYYAEDVKQSDIALELGVSRPLVSRMLRQARELGVVEISIHDPGERGRALLTRLRAAYSLRDGVLVPEAEDDNRTNRRLSAGILSMLKILGSQRVGIGWGHLIGELVSYLESLDTVDSAVGSVCPMIGNAGIPIRNYHSNENVRILAERLTAEPHFLYLPALAETREDRETLCSTEVYRQMVDVWREMDTALVNIGNYPSTPDLASTARYGTVLQKKRACGRMVAYFFNGDGEIIQSDQDYAIQIPMELLARCRNVVGLCSANTSRSALLGALRTGIFTHLVAREELALAVLDGK